MKRNLVTIGDNKSPLYNTLAGSYYVSTKFEALGSRRVSPVNNNNLLYIDVSQEDQTKLVSDEKVITALQRGIPIIINKPSATFLKQLTGLGVGNAEVALLVKGLKQTFYSKTLLSKDCQQVIANLVSKEVPNDQKPSKEEQTTAVSSSRINNNDIYQLKEPSLEQLINNELCLFDDIEEKLNYLAQKKASNDEEMPENREWSHFWDMTSWKEVVLTDPSDEQDKTQTARFHFSTIFSLLAADEPVKVKVFNVITGGTGFEPKLSDESFIRNDHKHRGWAQSLTFVEYTPAGNEFGNIQDYVPVNTSDQVSVTAGYSWDIGVEGGGTPDGPEASVSFSYSQDSSHTIATEDFRTLAESVGDHGMRFYHNAYVVGGDTIIDSRGLFGGEWTSEMDKMFYYHFPDGQRVRGWPSLALQLLKPDSDCIWYASPDETRTGRINWIGEQGVNYCYSKSGTNYCPNLKHNISDYLDIDLGVVYYE